VPVVVLLADNRSRRPAERAVTGLVDDNRSMTLPDSRAV